MYCILWCKRWLIVGWLGFCLRLWLCKVWCMLCVLWWWVRCFFWCCILWIKKRIIWFLNNWVSVRLRFWMGCVRGSLIRKLCLNLVCRKWLLSCMCVCCVVSWMWKIVFMWWWLLRKWVCINLLFKVVELIYIFIGCWICDGFCFVGWFVFGILLKKWGRKWVMGMGFLGMFVIFWL